MQILTQEQVEQFHREGYLKLWHMMYYQLFWRSNGMRKGL